MTASTPLKLCRIEAGFYSVRIGNDTYTVGNMAGQSAKWRGVTDTWVIRRNNTELLPRHRTLIEARSWLANQAAGDNK
jgi:hypothetical protein